MQQSNTTGFLECRSRGDVDNQLGHLHSRIRWIIPDTKTNTSGLDFKQYGVYCPNVLILNDVVDRDLAQRVREFAQSIKFDNTLPTLNDNDNQPKDSVFKNANNIEAINKAFSDANNSTENWMWEKYAETIWRATPLTLSSFIGSPIFELIDTLEKKWKKTNMVNVDMTKVWKATWVLQRVEKGHFIGIHNDEAPRRKISFVYYLTPDDWHYRIDGGELHVKGNDDEFYDVHPTFNSMVAWNMNEHKSPEHYVEEVYAENDRPRISLVGFWAGDD